MEAINNALRQAFMPKNEYQTIPRDAQSIPILKRPITLTFISILVLAIVISTSISVTIMFPSDAGNRPFCYSDRIQPLSINASLGSGVSESGDGGGGAFYLTDQETVDYYYVMLFVPSVILFFASSVYLVAGIMVACYAPQRHGCLKVVDNSYCGPKRVGARCLAILNMIFAIIFALLALFLGSSLLTLGSNCSLPLFWCYEVSSWSLVILYGTTTILLRRKAAIILDEGSSSGRNLGLEMMEANPSELPPDVERRINEGFRTWMGSSLLSSDEEDDRDEYEEIPPTVSIQSRQRMSP